MPSWRWMMVKKSLGMSLLLGVISAIIVFVLESAGLETNLWTLLAVCFFLLWLYAEQRRINIRSGLSSVIAVYKHERMEYQPKLEVLAELGEIDVKAMRKEHTALVEKVKSQLERDDAQLALADVLLAQAEAKVSQIQEEERKIKAITSRLKSVEASLELPEIVPKKSRGQA